MTIRQCISAIIIAIFVLPLAACSFMPPIQQKLVYKDGASIDNLTANVALSYSNAERTVSGSGILVYKKPDMLRVTILSPFGSLLQDVFVSGSAVTILYPANQLAYIGKIEDLPTEGSLNGWRYLGGVIEIYPALESLQNSTVERVNRYGEKERVGFVNGVMVSKLFASGGRASYTGYEVIGGTPVPMEIIFMAASGEQFAIRLEQPEINAGVEHSVFTPDLGRYRVLPLSALQ